MTGYAELHCLTNYSFLEGGSHPDELVAAAAELGYRALAVTDRDSLAGVVRAHVAAKEHGLKLLVGAELSLRDGPRLVVWATDRASYGRLCRLITLGRRRAGKGDCILRLADVLDHAEGLLAGLLPDHAAEPRFAVCREAFADRLYLLAELFRGPDDDQRLNRLIALSRRTTIPLVAANDVRYHTAARAPLHDVLTAIRRGQPVGLAGSALHPNAQRRLRDRREIARVFRNAPDAVRRTVEIADRCAFRLDELRYEYPDELIPPGSTPISHLTSLTWAGAAERYPDGLPDKIRALIEHELGLIRELKYEAYFLTVYDLVRFARSRGILCQGRGSAANSVVCYCLGVTAVDPTRVDLLFERFVSKERDEAPDIDVDFEHERREEVIQYLYAKYGRDRAGLAATVVTYCPRSAIRDVGKALGFSADRIDAVAKQVEGYHREEVLAKRFADAGVDPDSPDGSRWLALVNDLVSFPRHLSQHVGGMVMTRGPLCELAPIENAAMPDRSVVQWDKDDLEALGILKVDVLALGMLTAIRKCIDLIARQHGRSLTLATIPAEDEGVYDMICEADTIGVFQIESRGQMSMLPRLRPRNYYDLVIEVAIMRPGPIQGQMVHPYLRRRNGEERPEYPNDEIRAVLEKTLGVPLFQEQAMRLAVVAAGFTPGEADQLRRAMGAWRKTGVIEKFRHQLLEGMRQRGLSERFAEQVFQQIRGFGEYGFPESHAASFALLVYVSAWLKRHYPAAFAAALINSQPMGFYAPAQLIQDAARHGVEVRPADVNASEFDCTLEDGGALRLGFRLVSGLRRQAAEQIVAARSDGPFRSLPEFVRRTGLPRPAVKTLADADAFASLRLDRRASLWQSLAVPAGRIDGSLFAGVDVPEDVEALPELSPFEQVIADYRTTGLSLKGHPIGFYRRPLEARGAVTCAKLAELAHGDRVSVAGLVLLRQRPATAKGITFCTLEDETGVANLVLHPRTWERFYRIARRSPAWLAHGILENKQNVIHLVVRSLEDMTAAIQGIRVPAREFR